MGIIHYIVEALFLKLKRFSTGYSFPNPNSAHQNFQVVFDSLFQSISAIRLLNNNDLFIFLFEQVVQLSVEIALHLIVQVYSNISQHYISFCRL